VMPSDEGFFSRHQLMADSMSVMCRAATALAGRGGEDSAAAGPVGAGRREVSPKRTSPRAAKTCTYGASGSVTVSPSLNRPTHMTAPFWWIRIAFNRLFEKFGVDV